jgi:hypothetical protein
MQTTTAFCGGARYRPTTSPTVASSCGSVENLNPSVRCGCRPYRCHTRITLSWLTCSLLDRFSQSASRRADQCVVPCACSDSGGGVRVTARISQTVSSVSTVTGPPPRGASCSPASPRSPYCRRHLITVGSVHPARWAISAPVRPSAASRTIRARSTTRAGAPFDRARRSSSARSASGTTKTRTRLGMRHCPAFPRKHKVKHASDHELAAEGPRA